MHNTRRLCLLSHLLEELYRSSDPIDFLRSRLSEIGELFSAHYATVEFRTAAAKTAVVLGRRAPPVEGAFSRELYFEGFDNVSHHTVSEDDSARSHEWMATGSRPAPRLAIEFAYGQGQLVVVLNRNEPFENDELLVGEGLQCHFTRRTLELGTAGEGTAAAILVLDGPQLPGVLPLDACRLLERYFPAAELAAQSLPCGIHGWLKLLHQSGGLAENPRRSVVSTAGTLHFFYAEAHAGGPACLVLLEKRGRYVFSRLHRLGLTERQIEIAYWLTQGKTDAEMAILLDISSRTISKHVEHLLTKLGCYNRTAAAVQLIEWLSSPEAQSRSAVLPEPRRAARP